MRFPAAFFESHRPGGTRLQPPSEDIFPADPALLAADKMHILEELQDAVLCLGSDWRLTYANAAAMRISHIEPEYLHGKTYWELFPLDLNTELELRFHRVMKERVEAEHIFFYSPLQIWLDQRITPIDSGIALVYKDVTAQKLEESATLSTTRYLEQVFEQTSDGIVYLDRSYNVTFVNRRAQELLAPAGEILGTRLWESFPEVAYPESAFVVHLQKSMEQHLPCEFETYYPEPLNLWFCVESRPTDSGVIVFLRNATQAHLDAEAAEQRQQKVERQRAEIATLYQVAPVALALIDAVEFRYLRVNDEHAAFFGLVPQELVGTLVTDKEPIEGVLDLLKRVAQGESIRHQLLEGEITPSPGQKRFWTVNYSPVFESDGRVVAISAASLEITRQKQAEAALIQSEKLAAVGRLATSISHEINNPLESITNLLYLIATDNQLPASMRSYVTMAQEELARVSQIATQTLRFHRQSVRATLVEARQLLGAVLDLYGARLMNAGVTVEARFDSETFFPCFENDLRQVLNNLIANAIDAMPSGGRLLVRSHDMRDAITGQSGVRLTIADSGLGMSSATRARAFEPFYTTKDMNGTGLGLWISADIVNRHGGKLRFRSSQNPAHHGTVFSVFQPLSVDLSASMEPNADIHLEEQDLAS